MDYENATKFYAQAGVIKGARVMFMTSNGIDEHIHGYRVVSYKGLDPQNLEYVNTIKAKGLKSWDVAYDNIFGAPEGIK